MKIVIEKRNFNKMNQFKEKNTESLLRNVKNAERTSDIMFNTIRLIKNNFKFLTIFVGTITVLSSIYVFSLPRTYESEAILLPETKGENNLLEGLGSLASLSGIKFGGSDEDAISPEFYPKVLKSTVFLVDIFYEKVYVNRLKKSITVYEYIDRYQKKAWWEAFFEKFRKEEPETKGKANPKKLTKRQNKIAEKLNKMFFCSVDKTTDMITVSVHTNDAEVSEQIADTICGLLQKYITNYRTSKARKDLEYIKKITMDAKRKYIQAQYKYANFSDANEDVILASVRQVEERLENEMQLAYNVYSQSSQQMQLALAKVQDRTPVFTTIQPATVPLKPNAPKRIATLLLCIILSSFIGISYLIVKDYFKKYNP